MNTDFLSTINWLHVLIAAIGYFMLGAIWYSFLFRKKWIAYHRININDPDGKKGVGGVMLTSFVLMFLATAALAVLVNRLELSSAVSGLKLGMLTGLFFSATAISITYLYLKKPLGLHFIDGLYHTCGQIIAAVIICVWQ